LDAKKYSVEEGGDGGVVLEDGGVPQTVAEELRPTNLTQREHSLVPTTPHTTSAP